MIARFEKPLILISFCVLKIFQVIQLNKLPIVITLIAKNTANTGYLLTLEETLDPLVQALRGDFDPGE